MKQRSPGSWHLSVYSGWDERAGKRVYVTKTFRGSKRQAEKALADLVSEVNKQSRSGIAAGSLTLKEVLDTWLDARRLVLAANTVDRYVNAIRQVDASGLGAKRVSQLRPHHIEDFYNTLLAQGLSGASIRKVHWALRQSLAWAHRRGYCMSVATDGIELPPLGEKKATPPTSSDVRKFVEFALSRDPEWGTLFAFSAWTGCRRGEVCGLQWRDIEFAKRNVLIQRSVAGVPGGVEVKGTKTEEYRRIAIGPKTAQLLREHWERCETKAEACGASIGPSAFVFSPDPSGEEPYNPRSISRSFTTLCRQSGVPHMRLHDLRHHSATALLKNGTSVGEVMDRHGWKTVAMVTRYRHLLDAADSGAAEALENA